MCEREEKGNESYGRGEGETEERGSQERAAAAVLSVLITSLRSAVVRGRARNLI